MPISVYVLRQWDADAKKETPPFARFVNIDAFFSHIRCWWCAFCSPAPTYRNWKRHPTYIRVRMLCRRNLYRTGTATRTVPGTAHHAWRGAYARCLVPV